MTQATEHSVQIQENSPQKVGSATETAHLPRTVLDLDITKQVTQMMSLNNGVWHIYIRIYLHVHT